MRWDAHQLANVARAAGFDHDDTVLATALALATSGGIDHFDYRPGAPGSGRYVGLWGIDVDRFPWYSSRPLEVPTVAAATARELVADHRGWHWSPWYTAGRYAHHLDYAGTEATRTYDAQPIDRPVTMHDNADRLADTLERIKARTAARIGRVTTERR